MPDTEFDRKVSERRIVRKLATKDMGTVDSTMVNVTAENHDAVLRMIGRLSNHLKVVSELDAYILSNVESTDYDSEATEVYEFRSSLSETTYFLEAKLRIVQNSQSGAQPSTSMTADQLMERVPELELTEFDGNPLNFEEFWDDFSASVDNRSDISTITKFKLLRNCLTGKAAAACKGYRLTTANYSNVKSILEERYGDKETAIALHLGALIRLDPATSCVVSELIRVRDECEVHIRALVILGFNDDAFGQLFAPILLSKLPNDVRLDVRRQKKSSGVIKWTMKQLRELLSTEIELRASNECEFFGSCEKACGSEEPSSVKSRDTALFVSSNGQSAGTRAIACAFCGGHHYSSDCDVYLDVASRHSRMGDRCFLCLRRGHWKKDCRANRKPCFYCRKRDHHCSLCLRKFGSPSKLQRETEHQQQQLVSYEPHRFLPETICTANCRPSTGKNGVAILETAVATVIGKTGSCQARLVLDCGSTKSFMSAQLARRIGADLVGSEQNYIGRHYIGDATRVSKQLPRYKFSIVLRDGSSRNLHMNAEERLAPSVTLQPFDVDAIQPHCKPSDLAEVIVDSTTEAEVDILLGLDYYYSFVGQLLVRTDIGLILKESSLGIITTGYTQRATANASALSNRQSFFVSDNTVSRERPLPRGTSSFYPNLPPQGPKLQLPESWTSTLRALTSSPLQQTVV